MHATLSTCWGSLGATIVTRRNDEGGFGLSFVAVYYLINFENHCWHSGGGGDY